MKRVNVLSSDNFLRTFDTDGLREEFFKAFEVIDFGSPRNMGNIVFSNITGASLNRTSMPEALVEPPAASLFMGLRVSIFKSFSLKENGRIMFLKHLERIKER